MSSKSRETVYKAIDGERAYQDARPSITPDGRAMGSIVLLIDVYSGRAKEAYAKGQKGEVTAILRKIAALGVLGMETHGIAFRE